MASKSGASTPASSSTEKRSCSTGKRSCNAAKHSATELASFEGKIPAKEVPEPQPAPKQQQRPNEMSKSSLVLPTSGLAVTRQSTDSS